MNRSIILTSGSINRFNNYRYEIVLKLPIHCIKIIKILERLDSYESRKTLFQSNDHKTRLLERMFTKSKISDTYTWSGIVGLVGGGRG